MLATSKHPGTESSQKGAWLSIGTYVALTAAKLIVGWLTGSQAITADGLNNATDVIGSVAVLYGLKIAERPADEEHRYGHERAEGVASLIVATIMGLVSINVGFSAVKAIFAPNQAPPEAWGLWVALGAAAVMFGLYAYNLRLARRTGSKALEAAAYDHRSDALTSIGAAVGILGAQYGAPWADPLAGFAVAVMIARTAWEIGSEAAHMLMDGFADQDQMKALRNVVKHVDGVTTVRSMRARHLGNNVAIDVTVAVPCSMSVVEAHAVADQVEAVLTALENVQEVHVHVEPDVAHKVG